MSDDAETRFEVGQLRLLLTAVYATWCRQSASSQPQLLNPVYDEWHHPEDQFVADAVKTALAVTVPTSPTGKGEAGKNI